MHSNIPSESSIYSPVFSDLWYDALSIIMARVFCFLKLIVRKNDDVCAK